MTALDGHRVFAQLIVEQITGTKLPLSVFANSSPSIPRPLAKLRAGKPVKVTAVGLDAKLVTDAVQQVFANAELTVEERAFTEPSIPALVEQAATLLKSDDDDLLVLAMPRQPTPATSARSGETKPTGAPRLRSSPRG